MRFKINLSTPDNGEQFVSNAALITIASSRSQRLMTMVRSASAAWWPLVSPAAFVAKALTGL